MSIYFAGGVTSLARARVTADREGGHGEARRSARGGTEARGRNMDRSRSPRTPRLPPLEAKGEKPVFFFFVVALLNVVDSFNLNIVWPLLPFMVDSYGVARTEEDLGAWVGAAGAAVSVGQLLSSYAWGALSDRIGRRPVMLIGPGQSFFIRALLSASQEPLRDLF